MHQSELRACDIYHEEEQKDRLLGNPNNAHFLLPDRCDRATRGMQDRGWDNLSVRAVSTSGRNIGIQHQLLCLDG